MKSPAPYAIAAVFAALLLAFLYLFSYPLVVWFMVQYMPGTPVAGVVKFYRPALILTQYCEPYRATLDSEFKVLVGTGILWRE